MTMPGTEGWPSNQSATTLYFTENLEDVWNMSIPQEDREDVKNPLCSHNSGFH